MSTDPHDALRKVINHEANQDDDGGFFAKLYGFQPEHDDEGPTARGLFQHMDLNRNSYVYQYDPKIMPKKSAIDYLIDAFKAPFKAPFKPQQKRQPIVKVRSDEWGDAEGVYTVWLWECQICVKMGWTPNWRSTQQLANRHARNHHGGQVK